MKLLIEFVYLQTLDALTTLAFLIHGVAEANPIVRWALAQGPTPLHGLLFVKLFAFALAALCLAIARESLLRRVNYFFACLVAYNLVAMILAGSTA